MDDLGRESTEYDGAVCMFRPLSLQSSSTTDDCGKAVTDLSEGSLGSYDDLNEEVVKDILARESDPENKTHRRLEEFLADLDG